MNRLYTFINDPKKRRKKEMGKELLKIGVIGMGNCGGQMADYASGAGFDAVAINASQDDLNGLVNKVECFLVGDGNGTGKSRDNAKEFLREHSTIFKDERLISSITSHDVNVIATSIGGGFGSGSSLEVVSILSQIYPDRLFIPVGVMPFMSEGYTAQNHSIEWIQELEWMNVPYILYDNDRFAGHPEQFVCESIAKEFVNNLQVMRGDYVYDTKTGGIDPRDLLTTLSTPRRLVIVGMSGLSDDEVIEKSLIRTIKDVLDAQSAHADMMDDKQIMASATMYCLPEEFDVYKGTVRPDLQEIFGDHISDYTNFADITTTTNAEANPCMAVILAGLTAPQTRIGKIVRRRDKLVNDITSRKDPESKVKGVDTTLGNKMKLGVKSFGGSTNKTSVDVDQLLSKFSSGKDVVSK